MRVAFVIVVLLILGTSCKEEVATHRFSTHETSDPILKGMNNAIENAPTNVSIRMQKAEYLYKLKDYSLALEEVNKAMSIDSLNWDLYHIKADILLDYYRSKEAIATLQSILDKVPNRIQTLLKLSEFQHILKEYDNSVMTLNEIIRLQSYNPEAFFMLGMNFRAKGQSTEAKASFLRAVELDADLTDAWILLGNMAEEQRDNSAENYYANAVRSNEQSIEALHSLAYYLQNQNRIQEAIILYTQINGLDPTYEDAYLNTGILYLSIDSLDLAKEHFNILKKINPANPFGYYYIGLAEEYAGNRGAAKSEFENALRLKPDYNKAIEALEKY